ncbi:MAG: NAD(P)H-dependent oxidoreductase [Desulfomonile tiedjei]|nr:NAD(P)H-dependent oxidoreductase [Desulfomonile tiedjei]
MSSHKELLIVYHSQSGNTERLAEAVEQGALKVEGVGVRRIKAAAVTAEQLLDCRALVVCSPEYFGYMAGAIKDFFDRTYEQTREQVVGKSYAVVISAGNDGAGALNSIERIILGYRLRRVQEPVICRGPITEDMLENCRNLGQTLAAGIALGIF